MVVVDLLTELPYAAALNSAYLTERCSNCFKSSPVSACPNCRVTVYCSDHCLTDDRFEHEPECLSFRRRQLYQRGVVDTEQYGDEKLRLLTRVLRRKRRDNGLCDSVDKSATLDIQTRPLADLMTHLDDLHRDAVRQIHLVEYVEDFRQFFANTTVDMARTTVEEIEEIVGKMSINSFGISETTVDDELHIGMALYLATSRFDHSCRPNLTMDFDGCRIVYRYFLSDDSCSESPNGCRQSSDGHRQNDGQTLDSGQQQAEVSHQPDVASKRGVAPKTDTGHSPASGQQSDNVGQLDADRLFISYGYFHVIAGCTAVATRQQRRLSLASRYYFRCLCDWCQDDRDAELSEAATTRLCNVCRTPYVFRPDHVAGFRLVKLCQCVEGNRAFYDCFEDDDASKHLHRLGLEWSTTFSPLQTLSSASDAVRRLDPLLRLARRYWHPILNLRHVQLNEALFHAYRSIALSGRSVDACVFPIPDVSTVSEDDRRKALNGAISTGESVLNAYANRLEPYETVVARMCYQTAELCQMAGEMAKAAVHFRSAMAIWRLHGPRCQSQTSAVQNRIDQLQQLTAERQSPSIDRSIGGIAIGDDKDDKSNSHQKRHKRKSGRKKR